VPVILKSFPGTAVTLGRCSGPDAHPFIRGRPAAIAETNAPDALRLGPISGQRHPAKTPKS
jgi:hypothetical protein